MCRHTVWYGTDDFFVRQASNSTLYCSAVSPAVGRAAVEAEGPGLF